MSETDALEVSLLMTILVWSPVEQLSTFYLVNYPISGGIDL